MLKTCCMALVASLAFAGQALAAEARGFLGKPVHDRNGDRVGEVRDLIVDVNDARVVYVIIESQERYHTLPIRALDDQLRLDMELAGSIAHGQSIEDARFRRAASLLGRPVSQAGGAQIGTIRDIRFDPDSGQVEHVVVETVSGPRNLPASVLAQREVPAPGGGRGRAPEPDASTGITVAPSSERRRLQDPDW